MPKLILEPAALRISLGDSKMLLSTTKSRTSWRLTNPRVDVADYLVNAEVRMSALGSTGCRGLFATRDFEQGDLVLAEEAYFAVWAHEEGISHCIQSQFSLSGQGQRRQYRRCWTVETESAPGQK